MNWLGLEGVFVEQSVIAGGQCVVKNDVHLLPSEPTELVEIAKGIQEGSAPWIATTGRVRGFCVPEVLARHCVITHAAIIGECLVGPAQPVLGQRLVGAGDWRRSRRWRRATH